jgi:hypothetical protein
MQEDSKFEKEKKEKKVSLQYVVEIMEFGM